MSTPAIKDLLHLLKRWLPEQKKGSEFTLLANFRGVNAPTATPAFLGTGTLHSLSWTRFGDAKLMALVEGAGQPLVLEEGIVLLLLTQLKQLPNS